MSCAPVNNSPSDKVLIKNYPIETKIKQPRKTMGPMRGLSDVVHCQKEPT